jgi:hypothetical protein
MSAGSSRGFGAAYQGLLLVAVQLCEHGADVPGVCWLVAMVIRGLCSVQWLPYFTRCVIAAVPQCRHLWSCAVQSGRQSCRTDVRGLMF